MVENIIGFIVANPLATLIAQTKDGIEACHLQQCLTQALIIKIYLQISNTP